MRLLFFFLEKNTVSADDLHDLAGEMPCKVERGALDIFVRILIDLHFDQFACRQDVIHTLDDRLYRSVRPPAAARQELLSIVSVFL